MYKTIIPIKEASQEVILGLIRLGILESTGTGYRCKENSPVQTPTKVNAQD